LIVHAQQGEADARRAGQETAVVHPTEFRLGAREVAEQAPGAPTGDPIGKLPAPSGRFFSVRMPP